MYSSLSFNNDQFLPDLVFFILPHTLKLTAPFAKANPKHSIILSINALHILAETIEHSTSNFSGSYWLPHQDAFSKKEEKAGFIRMECGFLRITMTLSFRSSKSSKPIPPNQWLRKCGQIGRNQRTAGKLKKWVQEDTSLHLPLLSLKAKHANTFLPVNSSQIGLSIQERGKNSCRNLKKWLMNYSCSHWTEICNLWLPWASARQVNTAQSMLSNLGEDLHQATCIVHLPGAKDFTVSPPKLSSGLGRCPGPSHHRLPLLLKN